MERREGQCLGMSQQRYDPSIFRSGIGGKEAGVTPKATKGRPLASARRLQSQDEGQKKQRGAKKRVVTRVVK